MPAPWTLNPKILDLETQTRIRDVKPNQIPNTKHKALNLNHEPLNPKILTLNPENRYPKIRAKTQSLNKAWNRNLPFCGRTETPCPHLQPDLMGDEGLYFLWLSLGVILWLWEGCFLYISCGWASGFLAGAVMRLVDVSLFSPHCPRTDVDRGMGKTSTFKLCYRVLVTTSCFPVNPSCAFSKVVTNSVNLWSLCETSLFCVW